MAVLSRGEATIRAVVYQGIGTVPSFEPSAVDALLERAAPLPSLVKHRGLRLESAVILSLARALSRRLRRQDPLARRVRLPAPSAMLLAIETDALRICALMPNCSSRGNVLLIA